MFNVEFSESHRREEMCEMKDIELKGDNTENKCVFELEITVFDYQLENLSLCSRIEKTTPVVCDSVAVLMDCIRTLFFIRIR